jgi:outer membrane protein
MALCTLEAVPAKAESGGMMDKERWQVRVRAIGVFPDVGSSDVNIGGDADVGDAVTPEVDITYFLTDHVAAELIAATAQHQVDYTGNVNLGDTWILPPTVTLQYHFTPDNAFSPYVGAGVNYSLFYGEDSGAGFTDLEVDGGFGFALQGGVDYWLDEHWGLNVDVKKLWLDIDVHLNNGTIRTGDLELDPWIVGTGVSYRF